MPSTAGLAASIIRDDEAFLEIAAEWEALAQRAGPIAVTQGPAYARAAWETMPRDDGQALAVISIRRGGELMCVWPLYTRRAGRITVATHVGCGAGEYAGPVMLDDASTADMALAEARKLADVLEIYAIAAGSPVSGAVHRARGIGYANRLRSPSVSLDGFAAFEDWLAGKSRNFRQQIRKDRRGLALLGDLSAVAMSGPGDGPVLVDWLFRQKRAWLDGRGIGDSFARDTHPQALFASLLTAGGDFQGLALKLDGRIVAGCICLKSSQVLEYYMPAFDPEFAAFSPGNLLLEDCVRLALQEGRDFDFRLTQNAYKLRWADRFTDYETFILACSWRGVGRPVRAAMSRAVTSLRQRAAKLSARSSRAPPRPE